MSGSKTSLAELLRMYAHMPALALDLLLQWSTHASWLAAQFP